MQRLGMAKLDWLVVRDMVDDRERHLVEERPARSRPGETECTPRRSAPRCSSCRPPRTPRRPASFTKTQRLLQWRHAGRRAARRRPQRPVVHLPPGRAIRAKLAASTDERGPADPGPDLGLPGARARGEIRTSEAVLAEINGWGPGGRPLSSYTQLTADGSTACGCWIYCGVRADGVNQAARRVPWTRAELGGAGLGLGLAGQPARSSTTGPRPTRTAGRGASARR